MKQNGKCRYLVKAETFEGLDIYVRGGELGVDKAPEEPKPARESLARKVTKEDAGKISRMKL